VNAATLNAVIWAANFAMVAWFLRTQDGTSRDLGRWFEVVTASVGLVYLLVARDWAAAGFCAATLILLGWDWWNRGGRKAAKALGAKSRAALAAIVAKAREAGTPVPQGVPG
jgi:hypothetical protein